MPKVLYSVFELMQEHNAPQTLPSPTPVQEAIPPHPPKRNNSKEGWKSIVSTLLILISAPIVALLLIAFVFQSYEVDGPSMENTLSDGDRLIVVKTGKTLSRIQGNEYTPDRGDIIVFAKLGTIDPANGNSRQLIKRVIGLPGDRIVIQNGVITVFNEENTGGFNPDTTLGYSDTIGSNGDSNTDVDVLVPSGSVFVVGDNRSNSYDSRAFGSVKSDEIIGTLALRIFPFDSVQTF